jgi:hypothetical protein
MKEEGGANHVGEFIRRYSPLKLKMQEGRIMSANSFAAIRP